MLDPNTSAQLKNLFEHIIDPIEIIATLDNSTKSIKVKQLIDIICSLSPRIHARFDGVNKRVPSFGIAKLGTMPRIHFAGLPIGHEFTSLILALLHSSGYAPRVPDEVLHAIQSLNLQADFEVFVSLSCHNCPEVVQALNLIALCNPNTTTTMIDGAFFRHEIEELKIMAVPSIYQDQQLFAQGRMTLEHIISKLDLYSAQKAAAKLNAKATFDMLIIGGGPAGNSAAIYAARKGIRVGIVAERMGGQVMDTMDIENFLSVQKTQGAQFAAKMEAHVRKYGVDIMNLQRVTDIKSASQTQTGLVEIGLANGAKLEAKTVILATGSRWKEMNIVGEIQYRSKGVAYCPHCDGPLFKDKHVAVIGGGNSGVEAAIDLARIVGHVSLIEFDTQLHADQVLQDQLKQLSNISIIPHASPTEVLGNGKQVTALKYKNHLNNTEHTLELAGIFVQIGLLPNTQFLHESAIDLTEQGEIRINEHNETNLKGVFAAGDCTTVPYKQIAIATGEGAKAALSAFDYIMRAYPT